MRLRKKRPDRRGSVDALLVLFVCFLCFMCGLVLGVKFSTFVDRREAAEAGVAEWRVDPLTGGTHFAWRTAEEMQAAAEAKAKQSEGADATSK